MNGIISSQSNLDPEKGTPSIKGYYGNIFPDKSRIQVDFTADERGYLPKVRYRLEQPKVKILSDDPFNRILTNAIATLAGGGLGWKENVKS